MKEEVLGVEILRNGFKRVELTGYECTECHCVYISNYIEDAINEDGETWLRCPECNKNNKGLYLNSYFNQITNKKK